ncbi:MAG: DUF58 domain-containing protein [bacterium]
MSGRLASSSDSRRLLDPEVVASLRSMDLRARLVVEGFLAGLHRSPYRGFSVEFAEHRQYIPGDEIKRIDWRVYGKTGRYYVREYEEETNLRALLILDVSGSMAWRGDGERSRPVAGVSKLQYGSYLAAALAYLLIRQKDSVGLVVFNDRVRTYIPPRSAPGHLNVILDQLARLEPGGETGLADALHELAERVRRRGLIIIVSDLWDEPGSVLNALRHFRHRRHEVIVFHVLHPGERELRFRGPVRLRDLETGRELTVDSGTAASRYRESARAFLDRLESDCHEARIDYHLLTTDQPYDRALMAYLTHRHCLR